MPARSSTVCPAANASVAAPFARDRSPPDAVTSYSSVEYPFADTDTIAVVPLRVKSDASTPRTASENTTRHVRLSAPVGEDDGACRTTDDTVGAALSTTNASWTVPVGVVSAKALPARSSMSCSAAISRVAAEFNVARSPPDAVTSYSLVDLEFAATDKLAVVPLRMKSVASTPVTPSENVTLHVTLSAPVGDADGT